MKKILVPVDFSAVSGNSLRYARQLSGHLGADLSLLHCYPAQEYSRPYDFGKKDYKSGIGEMMSAFYEKSVNEPAGKIRFLAMEGSLVENVALASKDYDLVVLGSKGSGTGIGWWMGNRMPFIASTAKCPVLIIPASGEYRPIQKIWHIERREKEQSVIEKYLGGLKIDPAAVEVKSFDQTTFKSTIWQSVVAYVKKRDRALSQAIAQASHAEPIDLMILVSYEKNSFYQFVHNSAIQVIFQFNIPVLIFQAR